MIVEIDPKIISYSENVKNNCKNPYPKHSCGCPNYDSTKIRPLRGVPADLKHRFIRECPPHTSLIDEIIDMRSPAYMIYNRFNVGKDAQQRMETDTSLHTLGQFYNIRYWQDRARHDLYVEAIRFAYEDSNTIIDLCPEAHGVNLHKLMDSIGIRLRWCSWPPEHSLDNVVYQVCLAGFPKQL